MKIIEQQANWILYKDEDGYYLNSRCSWGPVEETAQFQLLANEVELYERLGNRVIHELSDQSNSPSAKAFFEEERPVSDVKNAAIHKCHHI